MALMERLTGARRALALLLALMIFASAAPMGVIAQDDEPEVERVSPRQLGELPSMGAGRPGPIGVLPGSVRAGVLPVALRIDAVDIEAPIEEQEIVDGVMQNPSGPFVVSWYKETGRLGELSNNVVLAGHLDYWDVGEAVFYNVWQLEEGDIVEVLGQNDEVFQYEVDWVRNFQVDELTPETIQDEIVGPTPLETITLITCGGPFNYEAGEYEERIVIRGTRVVDEEAA
jgi:LPXTG-site transpeptidase (sortase) family protein